MKAQGTPTDQERARGAEVTRVLRGVLWINLGVVALKLVAYVSSNALSVVAETVHSALDASNNVFALWIARVAVRGPDDDHPYGHAKFETLGALVLVGFLSITVFELMQRAILRLLSDQPPEVRGTPLAMGVMAVSVLVGFGVAVWEARRGRQLRSDILLADAAHTRSDVLTTAAVLGGLIAVHAGYSAVDPWITIAVAIIIARTGLVIVRETVPVLVDERAVDPIRIQRLAEAVAQVDAVYQIRSRGRPGQMFAELTIAVAPELDVTRSHEVADEVERQVSDELGAREVVVHVEPA
ncbi:MAG: cation diffusion facilitator family transporter [Gemmatimonadota bacterium]|nr:cation diffusion facilitator family transporter [Gemmatimonadota bacterium]